MILSCCWVPVEANWLAEAKAALAAGDDTLVSKILRDAGGKTSEMLSADVSKPATRVKATFAPGLTTETDLIPLTPYWDDHMWKLDIYIPLSIFDPDWISKDLLVAVKKGSKSKDKPTGQLPKSEWWLSFGDWTRASRLFIQYLREVYHHDAFASAMEAHFDYVAKLDNLHDWVTAFRYDIAVRSNVMCHHVNGSVADPSVKRPSFLESARAKTDTFKDGWIRRHDNRECSSSLILYMYSTNRECRS